VTAVVQYVAILLIVAGCSIVQSIFGVGILVFGTPLLLLLGLQFSTVLAYLLPCSLLVSALQIRAGWREVGELRWRMPLWLIPSVGVGLFIVLVLDQELSVRNAVGAMMIANACLRLAPRLNEALSRCVRSAIGPALALTGLVHGATNMGGGLLTLVTNAVVSQKEQVRANIAYGYFMMAASQLAVLTATTGFETSWLRLALPLVSVATYLAVGNRMFVAASQRAYQYAMTGMMFACGASLLGASLL